MEGGCEMDHRSVECLMGRVLSQIGAEGSLLSYPHLSEIAMHHPQFVCHLVKSKLPAKTELSLFEAGCRYIRDTAIDHSGRLLSASFLFFVSVTVFVAGMERHSKDELAEVLGWTHTVGRSTSDLFKVLIAFLTLTMCRLTPFLYRYLSPCPHSQSNHNLCVQETPQDAARECRRSKNRTQHCIGPHAVRDSRAFRLPDIEHGTSLCE